MGHGSWDVGLEILYDTLLRPVSESQTSQAQLTPLSVAPVLSERHVSQLDVQYQRDSLRPRMQVHLQRRTRTRHCAPCTADRMLPSIGYRCSIKSPTTRLMSSLA